MNEYKCKTSGISETDLGMFVNLRAGLTVDPEVLGRYGRSMEEIENYLNDHLDSCEECREIYESELETDIFIRKSIRLQKSLTGELRRAME